MVAARILSVTLISSLLAVLSINCFASESNPVDGAPSCRGILSLALLNSRFPVQDFYEVIKHSPSPCFALVAKTFGSRTKNVQVLIDKLRSNPATANRPITVFAYGDCGPCRSPRRPRGLFRLIAERYDIQHLNRALERGEAGVLSDFNREWVALERSLPGGPGIRYYFAPSLEDNLSPRAYETLLALARQVFAGRKDVTFYRNPLRGHRFKTLPLEIHTYDSHRLSILRRGDVVSGDGETLCFPGERCRGYSLSEVSHLVTEASKRGVHVLIYRPELQGLPPQSGNNPVFTPVSRRRFRVPGSQYLIRLMKGK